MPDAIKLTSNTLIQETFSSINDNIGYVHLSEISPGLGDRSIKLLDLVVPLRSDLTVSAVVNGSGLNAVHICRIGKQDKPLAVINQGKLSPMSTGSKTKKVRINDDFVTTVFSATKEILSGSYSKGLSLRYRPLILSPLWTPGVKREFADIDVLSAVNMFQYVVLLGAPGSGKTTTAKAIASAHFNRFITTVQDEVPALGLWNDYDNLPIYLELKSMVSDSSFPDLTGGNPNNDFFKKYIKQTLYSDNELVMNYVSERLTNGRVVLVLDGLDEVPIPNTHEDAIEIRHNQLQNLIRSIKTVYPKIKIIVTSRPAGYSGWTLDGFEVIHIRPLSSEEAANLAYSYYIAAGEDEMCSKQLTQNLVSEISRLPVKIREYPLFICLLASLFRDKEGAFPAKRGGLLQVSLDTLLGTWTERRHKGKTLQDLLNCSPEQVLNSLANIAFNALDKIGILGNTDTPDVPIAMALEEFYYLGDHINPTLVLNYIMNQAGIWTSPAPKKLRFVHRLFQEYLAAYAIAKDTDSVGKMTDLVIQNPVLWTEVSLLFADILSNRNLSGELLLFIEQLLGQASHSPDQSAIITLVASIIIDEDFSTLNIIARRPASIQTCIDILLNALSESGLQMDGKQRHLVGLALNELGDPRDGVALTAEGIPEIKWEQIPGGKFLMGSSDSEALAISKIDAKRAWTLQREQPQHEVTVESFMISRYPVTVIQFNAFVLADDGYQKDAWWTQDGLLWRNDNSPPNSMLPNNFPQNCVTWYEAIAFCRWLSYKTNSHIRLPTEAEWEYAARGNNYKQFVWGDEPDNLLANVRDADIGTISPVGCFPEKDSDLRQYHVFDMNGNLWEWCSTIVEEKDGRFFAYPYRKDDGREEINGGDQFFRATRGGYYDGEWMFARSCYRGRDIPSLRAERQGFRVVRENDN